MGIQVSGLLANQAFDWKSIVDQLVAADGIPIKTLDAQKTTNNDKVTALATLQTGLQDLQDSVQSMRADNVFAARTVSSDTANTTWKSSSVTGAAIGSYKIAVSQLATAAQVKGASGIAAGLSDTSDVSGITLASMRTATPATAGKFTVNGHAVTIALTDSLQDVFDKISVADPTVTASYDQTTDRISLTQSSGELVLGAANDTSNFLTVMKLANSGTNSASSAARLGTLSTSSTLDSAGLAADLSGVSSSGSFSINGVAISYNLGTDSLARVLNRINNSTAGVTASYDSANDRVVLSNKSTGDTGIGLSDSNGFLTAIGVTASGGGTLLHGQNALFKVNDGPTLASTTNTLDSSVHGITGLSVTVNSKTTQTLQVESDTQGMQASIQSFIDKFNAVQDFIDTNTKITVTGNKVATSTLSDNREVQEWGRHLQSIAFGAISGLTGSVSRLDNLGIDFDGVSGKLKVKDSGKLATALGDHPEDVSNFFLKPTGGFVSNMFGYLSTIKAADLKQQDGIAKANTAIDTQIATLQSRLDSEREQLTTSFIAMLDAQSKAQSQNSYLTNTYFNNNNGSCWVARAVYGVRNPRWIVFRHWLLHHAPGWFRALYLRHGERFADWLADKPWLRNVIRRWMDSRIDRLVPVGLSR
jgi:flagellar hook-associated protein 2